MTDEHRVQVDTVPLDDLYTDPANVRAHDDRNLAAIKASLRDYGQVEPLIAQPDGKVLAGNARLEAMQDLGWDHAQVVQLDIEEPQATKLAITLNRTAELADWHHDDLAQLLDALDGDIDPSLWRDDEVDELLARLDPDPDDIDDGDPTDTPDDPITEPGDVWTLGPHRLVCGDATRNEAWDQGLDGRTWDCLFTDPPYGVNYQHHTARSDKNPLTGEWEPRQKRHDAIEQDHLQGDELRAFLCAWIAQGQAHATDDAAWYIFTVGKTLREFLNAAHDQNLYIGVHIVWVKNTPVVSWFRYHIQHETILHAGPGAKPTGGSGNTRWYGPKNDTSVWEATTDPSTEYDHPTQKPVELAARAIHNSTAPGHLVVDPFLGSGTTLIACEQLDRPCAAIELEPKYVDVAVQRWETLTGQEATRR